MLPTLVWEHQAEERLQLNTAIFSLAFIYTTVAAVSSGIPGRAKIALTTSAVHFIAGLSYFIMSRNLVPLIITPNTGRPLVLARLIEWSITVPCLLMLIGWLVDPDYNRVNKLRTRQMLCLLVGGLGPLAPFPMNWLFYGVSCYLQVLVLFHMHSYFTGMKRKLRSRHDRMCIWMLHGVVLVIFFTYPLVWVLAVELEYLPLAAEMAAFANLDISAKLVLTSVLSNLTAAAYDYALVDFPEYFRGFMNSVSVPAFAVSEDFIVTHWNTCMEHFTGHNTGDVLYEMVDKCGAFTHSGVKAVKDALEPAKAVDVAKETVPIVSGKDGISGDCPIIEITFHLRSNPQDTYTTQFYVLHNVARTESLPHMMLVEASANTGVSQAAMKEMAKHFWGQRGMKMNQ